MMQPKALQVRRLTRTFKVHQRGTLFGSVKHLRAVDNISFDVAPGEMLGIVGESGCGKSTTARMILGVTPSSAGEVTFGGEKVTSSGNADWRSMRSRMQMVYQDPLAALDPRLTAAAQIGEPLIIHRPDISASARRERINAAMHEVGLSDHHGARYPHELSGGQRQRVVIARSLIAEPELLVCDEPVSALDVSVQAQVINVLVDLRTKTNLTSVFISHDLKVVRHVADRVAVMYLGRIVEIGNVDEILHSPAHPYTQALVSAMPMARGRTRERIILKGDPPNPANVPSGCPFHTRCPVAQPFCRETRPELMGDAVRSVACHLVNGSELTKKAG